MISIVFVGRNDNYGGDFEDRLMATTRYNLAELQRRGVEAELVFVEWNPIEDEPLLSRKVADSFEAARCFVVDGSVHRLINGNHTVKVMEYRAKNVGARHARGDWLLLTNPDDFFGDDILDFLQRGAFDPQAFYRAALVNIETAADINRTDLPEFWAGDPPPYTGGSGDFLFCAKSLFDRAGGYREDVTFTNMHIDAILCLACRDLTDRVHKIGRTYHVIHGKDDAGKRRLQYEFKHVDRTPQKTYGVADTCIETPVAPRITRLTLPDDLRRQADGRAPAEPHIPFAYRVAPPGFSRLKRESLQAFYALRRALRRR